MAVEGDGGLVGERLVLGADLEAAAAQEHVACLEGQIGAVGEDEVRRGRIAAHPQASTAAADTKIQRGRNMSD